MDLTKARDVSQLVQKCGNYTVDTWKPVVGKFIFTRESGGVASQFHMPSAIEPYSATVVGADRKIALGKKSGLANIKIKLDELGLEAPAQKHAAILEKVIDFRDVVAGSKYSGVIIKAQEYIQNNYFEQSISLHSVAKEVNISPNHFSTIFSQETGETFINYVTRTRLTQAKELLKNTKMRTSDIGYDVGYNDTHYFSYVFKKNIGMTPKEYRAAHQ